MFSQELSSCIFCCETKVDYVPNTSDFLQHNSLRYVNVKFDRLLPMFPKKMLPSSSVLKSKPARRLGT